MTSTTNGIIVRIDRSETWRIDADRYSFCEALKEATTKNTPKAWAALREYGIERIGEGRRE